MNSRSNAAKSAHTSRERRTASLIQACYKHFVAQGSHGTDHLYALCQLPWITRSPSSDVLPDNTRKVVAPALATLTNVGVDAANMAQLQQQLIAAKVTEEVTHLAIAPVGFVNFYPAFRNVARTWIKENRNKVETMARLAASATSDLEARAAYCILDSVPPIMAANGRHLHPAALITPLLACLDPRGRSPIINSRNSVQTRLRALGLRRSGISDQFDGLVNLIGQAGIADAFELDTADVDLVKALSPTAPNGASGHGRRLKPKNLHERGDGDVEYLRTAATVKMRRLHNSMTNALLTFCVDRALIVTEGLPGSCMYDALITAYDKERHLLVEVKTDSAQPTCRLAVGQLLDYRSQLPDRARIDLAVLFPTKPTTGAQRFLDDVGVKSLWFERNLSAINDLSNPQRSTSQIGTP